MGRWRQIAKLWGHLVALKIDFDVSSPRKP
jgi:hypothetical protein